MNPRLIICVDGFGKDLISKEDTPFLYNFSKENYLSELETLFAFTGLEYCFFTGKTPKESGIWLEFEKSEKSIFDNILIKIFGFNKKIRDYCIGLYQYLKGRTWISGLHNIPLNKIKYFDSSAKDGLWKLEFFKNSNFAFYKWPFFVTNENKKEKIRLIFRYEDDEQRLNRLLREDKELYYTQLMSIDKTIHKFGKKSKETKEALRKIDKILGEYITKFIKERKGRVFIWSDHGFADIKKYIDIEKSLPKREDYLYFIAGTTLSFWFKNKEAEKEVIKTIKKFKEIKILNGKKSRRYKMPLSKKYGDLIFYVEKGYYFFPNFYQKSQKEKFVSMHGYPDDGELNGFLISNQKIPKTLKIEDVVKFLR